MKAPTGARRGPPALLASPLALLLAAALFAGFTSLVLPRKAAEAAAYTPAGAGFDLSFAYSPAEALDRAASFEPAGRLAYIHDRWTFDLAWPLVYGSFVLVAWSFALARLGPRSPGSPRGVLPARGARLLPALTLLGPAFDYAENIAATVLLSAVPERPEAWAWAASVATPLKWVFVMGGTVGALLLVLVVFARGLLRRRS